LKSENPQIRQSENRSARRFVVSGRVQGVGFRWFVENEASRLGVAGWVRNRQDGTVEVLAAGSREQLSALHDILQRGPRAARVDAVDVSEAEPTQDLKSFRVEGTT
jgi:acylphosphatase